jgi:hypothetical protein
MHVYVYLMNVTSLCYKRTAWQFVTSSISCGSRIMWDVTSLRKNISLYRDVFTGSVLHQWKRTAMKHKENSHWIATRPLKKKRPTSTRFDLLMSIRTDWQLSTRTNLNIGCNVHSRQTPQSLMKYLSYAISSVQKHGEFRYLSSVFYFADRKLLSVNCVPMSLRCKVSWCSVWLTYIKFNVTAFQFKWKL